MSGLMQQIKVFHYKLAELCKKDSWGFLSHNTGVLAACILKQANI